MLPGVVRSLFGPLDGKDIATCCICLESLDTPGEGRQTLPCGHVMHERCITEMRRIGGSGCCPLCQEKHEDLTPIQILFDRAIMLLARSDYQEVFTVLTEAHALDPDNCDVNVLLAACYQDGLGVPEDIERAIELYEIARHGGHLPLDAAYSLGALHRERGNMKQAMELFEIGSTGGDVSATYNLALAHYSQGNNKKASELFEIASSCGLLDATYNLGVVHHEEGNIKKAMELYKLAAQGGISEADRSLMILQYGSSLSVGDRVLVSGLVSEAGAILNGCEGVVRSIEPNSRIAVKIDRGALKSLKRSNLALIAPSAESVCASASSSSISNRAARSLTEVSTSSRQFDPEFKIGDLVYVKNLKDAAVFHLNGCTGQVLDYDKSTGRYDIWVRGGDGLKALRPENLTAALAPCCDESLAYRRQDLVTAFEEAVAEDAIDAQARSLHNASAINARIGDALIRSGTAEDAPRVLLLKFSRRPQALRTLLLEAAELKACREALLAQEMDVELPCGTKIFVRPEHYGPTLEAIRLGGLSLTAAHVVVDVDMEQTLLSVLRTLRFRPHSVRHLSTSTVPLAFADAATDLDTPVNVSRTFIHIKVPSSLYSTSHSGVQRTVSTTEADPRKCKNHRSSKRAGFDSANGYKAPP